MKTPKHWLLLAAMFFALGAQAQKKNKKNETPAPPPKVDTAKKAPAKVLSINEKIKSSKKNAGLFTVYQDTANGTTQLFVHKNQINKEFIYQSFSISGPTMLYLNQSMHRANFIFAIRKVYDKIEFAIQNLSFYYDTTNAIARSANVDVAEAVFISEKIVAEDSTGYLISADGMFISEKMDPVRPTPNPLAPPGSQFNLGQLSTAKSRVSLVRSFEDNTDVVVDLAYDNPMPLNGGGRDITDARYNRVRMQHSFIEIPKNDFRPRRDDPRIGYFTSEVDDLTSSSAAPFRDVINRWYLKKKDANAAMSEPEKPITYWIENTTPYEYRELVKEAGLKWNEAFEAAGFRNAVVMKQMPDVVDWDPADIHYNVIRWVSSSIPGYGAIGPSFTNPRTGQILGSDITIEFRAGVSPAWFDDLTAPISAWKSGDVEKAIDEMFGPATAAHFKGCNIAHQVLSMGDYIPSANAGDDDQSPTLPKLTLQQKQFMYYLVMHEMGHTLGLNHNMKASQMLSPAQINDTTITHKIGLMGSVMDYPAVNIALDPKKQGDYYTTKVGPYDVWAIQYGYTPFHPAEEEAGLAKILSRSNEPNLAFGNDADDMRGVGSGIDPRVMINDLSNDPFTYADERLRLVNNLMKDLRKRAAKPNESYASVRRGYNYYQSLRRDMLNSVANYVGGVYVDRSFVGQTENSKPFTPVMAADQKKAITLLGKYLFAPNAFDVDAQVFPYLQQQRRGYNFFGSPEDVKPTSTVLSLQIQALMRILNPVTTRRVNNSSLYGNTYGLADIMADLNTALFSQDLKSNVNLYRQNLQTEYVKMLASVVNAPISSYDNPSKAAAYNTLRKVKGLLASAVSTNEESKAHRAALGFLIDKALSVN